MVKLGAFLLVKLIVPNTLCICTLRLWVGEIDPSWRAKICLYPTPSLSIYLSLFILSLPISLTDSQSLPLSRSVLLVSSPKDIATQSKQGKGGGGGGGRARFFRVSIHFHSCR